MALFFECHYTLPSFKLHIEIRCLFISCTSFTVKLQNFVAKEKENLFYIQTSFSDKKYKNSREEKNQCTPCQAK